MPLDSTPKAIEADYPVLQAIERHLVTLTDRFAHAHILGKTLRQWLGKHPEQTDDLDMWKRLVHLATDLELFSPSMSGRTAVDRYVHAFRSAGTASNDTELQAIAALSAAHFRLVRIVEVQGQGLIVLHDLVTGARLHLIGASIGAGAVGMTTSMRLCPLASGRHVLISVTFSIDAALLATAMTFVRPGHPLGHGARCAGAIYRMVARQGIQPLPEPDDEPIAPAGGSLLAQLEAQGNPLARLAARMLEDPTEVETPDFLDQIRRITSMDNLVNACGCCAAAEMTHNTVPGLVAAFERIAGLQIETILARVRIGVAGSAEALDSVASIIAGHIARDEMGAGASKLFQRLRARHTMTPSAKPTGNATSADLDRVIQRITGLRAKTVDRGCTEQEAMAAAAKVSELLQRHDLTLDAISVRDSDCEGASIATGRKRRAPVDDCIVPIATFCDCRVWSEGTPDGALRYLFFGLKADVAAARFLHELIEDTFETESTNFRLGKIYQAQSGGDRRVALNSFQTGLARGISAKLDTLKTERSVALRAHAGPVGGGFDLVAAKSSVLDEEMARLGLNFTARATSSRRQFHGDAFAAGKAAGARFEPNAALGR